MIIFYIGVVDDRIWVVQVCVHFQSILFFDGGLEHTSPVTYVQHISIPHSLYFFPRRLFLISLDVATRYYVSQYVSKCITNSSKINFSLFPLDFSRASPLVCPC